MQYVVRFRSYEKVSQTTQYTYNTLGQNTMLDFYTPFNAFQKHTLLLKRDAWILYTHLKAFQNNKNSKGVGSAKVSYSLVLTIEFVYIVQNSLLNKFEIFVLEGEGYLFSLKARNIVVLFPSWPNHCW